MNLEELGIVVNNDVLNVQELFKLYLLENEDGVEIENKLNNISLEEIKGIVEGRFFGIVDDELLYSIPLLFIEKECFDLKEDIKEYLKEILEKSIKCYCEDETSMLEREVDINDKEYFLYVLQLILVNFETVITGDVGIIKKNVKPQRKSINIESFSKEKISALKKEWKKAIVNGRESISNIPKELMDILGYERFQFMADIIKKNPSCVVDLPEIYKIEWFIKKLIKSNYLVYKYLDKEKYDLNFAIKCLKNTPMLYTILDKEDKTKAIIRRSLKKNWRILGLDPELAKNKVYVKIAISKDPEALTLADSSIKEDRDFIVSLIKDNPYIFEYVEEKFKRDWEIIFMAVDRDYALRCFIDESLKRDKSFIIEYVSKYYLVFRDIDEKFKKDRDVVLAAVKSNGYALEYVDEEFKRDKEIVLLALKGKGNALRYLNNELIGDIDVVSCAINYDGALIRYASEDLKKNRDIVLQAVKNNGCAIKYVDEKYRKDKEMVLIALERGLEDFSCIDDSLKEDEDVMEAIRKVENHILVNKLFCKYKFN